MAEKEDISLLQTPLDSYNRNVQHSHYLNDKIVLSSTLDCLSNTPDRNGHSMDDMECNITNNVCCDGIVTVTDMEIKKNAGIENDLVLSNINAGTESACVTELGSAIEREMLEAMQCKIIMGVDSKMVNAIQVNNLTSCEGLVLHDVSMMKLEGRSSQSLEEGSRKSVEERSKKSVEEGSSEITIGSDCTTMIFDILEVAQQTVGFDNNAINNIDNCNTNDHTEDKKCTVHTANNSYVNSYNSSNNDDNNNNSINNNNDNNNNNNNGIFHNGPKNTIFSVAKRSTSPGSRACNLLKLNGLITLPVRSNTATLRRNRPSEDQKIQKIIKLSPIDLSSIVSLLEILKLKMEVVKKLVYKMDFYWQKMILKKQKSNMIVMRSISPLKSTKTQREKSSKLKGALISPPSSPSFPFKTHAGTTSRPQSRPQSGPQSRSQSRPQFLTGYCSRENLSPHLQKYDNKSRNRNNVDAYLPPLLLSKESVVRTMDLCLKCVRDSYFFFLL